VNAAGEKFEKILNNFCSKMSEIETAAIISSDGLPISMYSKNKVDNDLVTTISAAAQSFYKSSEHLTKNSSNYELIQMLDQELIFISFSEKIDLQIFVYTQKTIKVGFILYLLRDLKKKLEPLFE
jgi:predicted regulator of Ras-like GTPase activity (Roadblock/LC7/MglB family)